MKNKYSQCVNNRPSDMAANKFNDKFQSLKLVTTRIINGIYHKKFPKPKKVLVSY